MTDQLLPESTSNLVQPDPAAVETTATATFARRKNRGANIRKRPADGEAGEEGQQGQRGAHEEGGGGGGGPASAVVRTSRQVRGGEPLAFSTKAAMTAAGAVTSGVMHEGTGVIGSGKDNLATGTLETETQMDRDARCVLLRNA